MAQFGRPISDVSIGVWTDDVGGTTNIYQAIDDNSNTDYIEDLNGGNGTAEFNLTSLIDPEVTTGHVIRFSMQGTGSGSPERCEVQLWQGTSTQIATTGTQTSRASWVTKTYNITEVEAGNITDYTDLNIRVISSNLAGTEDMWVGWVELEIPDAPSTDPVSGTIAGGSSSVVDIFGRGVVSGTIAGGSSSVVDIFGRGVVSGTIAGGSSSVVDIFGRGAVSGTIAGGSALSANVVDANLSADLVSGTIAGGSSSVVDIFGRGVVSGTITGGSSSVVDIFGRGAVSGTIVGGSSSVMDISAIGYLSGTISGGSSSVVDISAIASISGTIVGSSLGLVIISVAGQITRLLRGIRIGLSLKL